MLEFFDCVRSRKECSENAEVGHHAAAAGHMVNISYRSAKGVLGRSYGYNEDLTSLCSVSLTMRVWLIRKSIQRFVGSGSN